MQIVKLTGIPEAQLIPAPATTMIRLDCSIVPVNCRKVVCEDSGRADEALVSRVTCFILNEAGDLSKEGSMERGEDEGRVLISTAARKERKVAHELGCELDASSERICTRRFGTLG